MLSQLKKHAKLVFYLSRKIFVKQFKAKLDVVFSIIAEVSFLRFVQSHKKEHNKV